MSDFQVLDYLFFWIILGCFVYWGWLFYKNYVKINRNTNDVELMEKYVKLQEIINGKEK